MQKNIVIAGGGYTGVLAAKKLWKKLKKHDVKITLIDRNPYHTMLTELHEVAAGRVEPSSILIPFDKIFRGRGVDVVMDTVLSVNSLSKTVKCENSEYNYDYLILCTGSRPKYYGIPGAKEHGFGLWSFDDALKIKKHIHECFYKAAHTADKNERSRQLCFIIAGAAATGVEMAGELAEYIPSLCHEYNVDESDTSVYCVDAAGRAVTAMPEKCAERLEKRLKKLGVKTIFNCYVNEVRSTGIKIKLGAEDRFIPGNTVIWAAGTSCSELTSAIEGITPGENGRIKTDEYLRAINDGSIYVGGDCLMYEYDGQTVPQMVENAEHSADIIAENISCEIKGLEEKVPYEPVFHGSMVSCGGRYGTACVGGGKKRYILPSFPAMLVKHLINVVYFIQVAGWNKVASYSRHEFFRINHRRSFVGGHFAVNSPTFMLVPLRIFTGVYWIIEAVEKIADGWLKSPQLIGFFSGAAEYFNSAVDKNAVADAVTSATSGASAAELVFRWNVLGVFDFAFVKGGGDYAFRSGFLLTDWFVDNIVLRSDATQMFFQIFIIVSELIIGALIVIGLFSFPANFYALILQAMFLMTTGLYLSTWWLVFASLACAFGGGMSFGADYYLSPRIKKRLRKGGFTGKWYLYND